MVVPSVPSRPALGKMIRRGALRRCPWCGDRHAYFTGWFSKQPACRRCGTPWRRGDSGFELGAATVNTIITFALIVAAFAVAMIATYPDIPTWPIVIGLVIAAAVIPVLIYPITYTLWQALDLAMRPPEPGGLPSSPVL
ncbi:MAG: DUF983 domain-containing protein [Ilumatobacteraceae bacterium]